jgi:hypothetical protein
MTKKIKIPKAKRRKKIRAKEVKAVIKAEKKANKEGQKIETENQRIEMIKEDLLNRKNLKKITQNQISMANKNLKIEKKGKEGVVPEAKKGNSEKNMTIHRKVKKLKIKIKEKMKK